MQSNQRNLPTFNSNTPTQSQPQPLSYQNLQEQIQCLQLMQDCRLPSLLNLVQDSKKAIDQKVEKFRSLMEEKAREIIFKGVAKPSMTPILGNNFNSILNMDCQKLMSGKVFDAFDKNWNQNKVQSDANKFVKQLQNCLEKSLANLNNSQANSASQNIPRSRRQRLEQRVSNLPLDTSTESYQTEEQLVLPVQRQPTTTISRPNIIPNTYHSSRDQTSQAQRFQKLQKQFGRCYTSISSLKKPQLKQEGIRFNFCVRVIKQLLFRVENQYIKIKFIAADETGFVVCYANFKDYIHEGEYVLLHDCIMVEYQQRSYQVNTYHCQRWINNDNFAPNLEKENCISSFESIMPLVYTTQRYDSTWPSIIGLKGLNFKKHNNINLIAGVEELCVNGKNWNIYIIYDGTKKIYAKFDKGFCNMIEVGKVYWFRGLEVGTKLGNKEILHVRISDYGLESDEPPIEESECVYDEALKNESLMTIKQ